MSQHDHLVTQLAQRLSTTNPASVGQKDDTAPVDVIRTHISSVILTRDLAYKIKRDIKLPFLDFSTSARRHAFCQKELTINRRTAPDIYLAVVPITGSPNDPQLDGDGPIIDWAVKMRRFEAGMLLSDLAQNNHLTQTHITTLAQHIAQFHLDTQPLEPADLAHVKPTPVWLEESLNELQTLCADNPQRLREIATLRTWSTKETQKHQALFGARKAQGWYRECHGDLHLANLTCTNQGIVAFDALEFDDDLRTIDVINEVAFPFMDLHAHGLRDLAWQFLNLYVQITGDQAGLVLLPYYVRYRAAVRAKIALFTQRNAATPADRALCQEQFERYWQLSCEPGLTHNKPKILLVSGVSGTGKSTVAQYLCQMLGAVWLRADTERKRLFPQPDPAQRYSDDASEKTYAKLADLAQTLAANGLNVVVDATFLDQQQVQRFAQLPTALETQGLNVSLHAIVCQATDAQLEQRILARKQTGTDPSEATLAVLTHQKNQLARTPVIWPFAHHVVRNDGTLEDLRQQLRDLTYQQGL